QQHAAPPFEGFVVQVLLDVQHVRAQPRQRNAPPVDLHAFLLGERGQRRFAGFAGDQLFGDVVHARPEIGELVALVAGRFLRAQWREQGEREDQAFGLTSRMRPSWAVLAASTPARVYRLPRAKPRAPELEGLSRL